MKLFSTLLVAFASAAYATNFEQIGSSVEGRVVICSILQNDASDAHFVFPNTTIEKGTQGVIESSGAVVEGSTLCSVHVDVPGSTEPIAVESQNLKLHAVEGALSDPDSITVRLNLPSNNDNLPEELTVKIARSVNGEETTFVVV